MSSEQPDIDSQEARRKAFADQIRASLDAVSQGADKGSQDRPLIDDSVVPPMEQVGPQLDRILKDEEVDVHPAERIEVGQPEVRPRIPLNDLRNAIRGQRDDSQVGEGTTTVPPESMTLSLPSNVARDVIGDLQPGLTDEDIDAMLVPGGIPLTRADDVHPNPPQSLPPDWFPPIDDDVSTRVTRPSIRERLREKLHKADKAVATFVLRFSPFMSSMSDDEWGELYNKLQADEITPAEAIAIDNRAAKAKVSEAVSGSNLSENQKKLVQGLGVAGATAAGAATSFTLGRLGLDMQARSLALTLTTSSWFGVNALALVKSGELSQVSGGRTQKAAELVKKTAHSLATDKQKYVSAFLTGFGIELAGEKIVSFGQSLANELSSAEPEADAPDVGFGDSSQEPGPMVEPQPIPAMTGVAEEINVQGEQGWLIDLNHDGSPDVIFKGLDAQGQPQYQVDLNGDGVPENVRLLGEPVLAEDGSYNTDDIRFQDEGGKVWERSAGRFQEDIFFEGYETHRAELSLGTHEHSSVNSIDDLRAQQVGSLIGEAKTEGGMTWQNTDKGIFVDTNGDGTLDIFIENPNVYGSNDGNAFGTVNSWHKVGDSWQPMSFSGNLENYTEGNTAYKGAEHANVEQGGTPIPQGLIDDIQLKFDEAWAASPDNPEATSGESGTGAVVEPVAPTENPPAPVDVGAIRQEINDKGLGEFQNTHPHDNVMVTDENGHVQAWDVYDLNGDGEPDMLVRSNEAPIFASEVNVDTPDWVRRAFEHDYGDTLGDGTRETIAISGEPLTETPVATQPPVEETPPVQPSFDHDNDPNTAAIEANPDGSYPIDVTGDGIDENVDASATNIGNVIDRNTGVEYEYNPDNDKWNPVGTPIDLNGDGTNDAIQAADNNYYADVDGDGVRDKVTYDSTTGHFTSESGESYSHNAQAGTYEPVEQQPSVQEPPDATNEWQEARDQLDFPIQLEDGQTEYTLRYGDTMTDVAQALSNENGLPQSENLLELYKANAGLFSDPTNPNFDMTQIINQMLAENPDVSPMTEIPGGGNLYQELMKSMSNLNAGQTIQLP